MLLRKAMVWPLCLLPTFLNSFASLSRYLYIVVQYLLVTVS